MDYKEKQANRKEEGRTNVEALRAAEVLETHRTGLILTGRIRNGKLEIDQASLDEVAEKFPTADISFVAMNSPFDPESQPV